MNINVNNCEAFFLDYYEGNLSEGQVAELFAFLKSHPQMRETFESFADVSAEDDHEAAPDFSFLKKEETVNEHEQAEVWMVELIENCISEEDRNALNEYFSRYPEKRKELEQFRQTILVPDKADGLDSSSSLKKANGIHADNFPDFAIALVEGTISANDQQQLDAFIAAHAEYANELELYRRTVCTPGNEVFDGKDALKKTALQVSSATIDELLIAKLEGHLSAVEIAAVDHFVVENPQYAKEWSLLTNTIVRPDSNEVFDNKNVLYRGVAPVTEENFEEMAIAYAEGLLNAEEVKALVAFAGKNAKRLQTLQAYAAVKVSPDLQVVYADKEGLKRKDRGGFIWWSAGVRFAAAAVIILLLAVYVFLKYGSATADQPQDVIANNNTPSQQNDVVVTVPDTAMPIPVSNQEESAVATQNSSPVFQNANLASNVKDKANTKNQNVEFVLIPARNPVQRISNDGNDQVNFSDALYAVVYEPVKQESGNEYISPGQIAMRWMKDKLDGKDNGIHSNELLVKDTPSQDRNDKNVDGMDLTESAVNRVGMAATNGNVSMHQSEDETWLKLWKYNFRVSGRP